MKGADEYASLIPTGQYGRLYCVSGEHARGKTFSVFVLPKGVVAVGNGSMNPPLNKDAVEVFGATCGQLGWTEEYGWLRKGVWQADLEKLANSFRLEKQQKEESQKERCKEDEEMSFERSKELLSDYENDTTDRLLYKEL